MVCGFRENSNLYNDENVLVRMLDTSTIDDLIERLDCPVVEDRPCFGDGGDTNLRAEHHCHRDLSGDEAEVCRCKDTETSATIDLLIKLDVQGAELEVIFRFRRLRLLLTHRHFLQKFDVIRAFSC
jgi:hypothetical protein